MSGSGGSASSFRPASSTIGSALRLFESEITAGRAVLELYRKSEAGVAANGVMVNMLWAF